MYHKNGVAKFIVLLSLIKANYNWSGNTIFVIHKLSSTGPRNSENVHAEPV